MQPSDVEDHKNDRYALAEGLSLSVQQLPQYTSGPERQIITVIARRRVLG